MAGDGAQAPSQYAEAIYHVMNREIGEKPSFRDDQDYEIFLSHLEEACERNAHSRRMLIA